MSITDFNKTSKFDFHSEEKLDYLKLSEAYPKQADEGGSFVLLAFYKNTKSKYGESYVATVEIGGKPININLPKHMNATMAAIYKDDDAIAEINARKAGIEIYTYFSATYKKDCYSVRFVEYADSQPEKFMEVEGELPFLTNE